jgi:hypothetical protein
MTDTAVAIDLDIERLVRIDRATQDNREGNFR